MRKILFLALACLMAQSLFAQTKRDALAEFDWLIGYVRRNYPGYELKTQGKEKEWKEFVRSQREAVAMQPDTLPIVLDNCLKCFNDGHLYLRLSNKELFRGIIQREIRRYELQYGARQQSINMYYTARKMNDSTFFLRIPSFASDKSNKIVEENFEAITTHPYLIIDLRANTGGDDINYKQLMSLIYSKPYLTHGVELYATEDFLEMYKRIIAESSDADWVGYYKKMVSVVEENMGGYALRPDSKRIDVIKQDTIYSKPRKVGILIHGQNASSAEQFILEARESEKVVLFGNENTRGVVDLSNVYGVNSPLGWFKLYIPTTRSCRLPDIVIDGKGIAPHVPIPYKESLQEKDNIGDEIRYIERVLRGIEVKD